MKESKRMSTARGVSLRQMNVSEVNYMYMYSIVFLNNVNDRSQEILSFFSPETTSLERCVLQLHVIQYSIDSFYSSLV